MKVLYDYQTFILQDYGGISRYFSELMNYYHLSGETNFELPLLLSNNHYIAQSSFSRHLSLLKGKKVAGQKKAFLSLNQAYSRFCLSWKKFDVFHPTYYDPYFYRYLKGKPFVLTIHDMVHELYPQYLNDSTALYKKELAYKAAKIIAVSENTKKDILNLYKELDEKKIEVIYLASSLKRTAGLQLELPEKYILFVGTRGGYKNFNFFINALAILLQKDPSLHVVCVGGKAFTPQELSTFRELKIERQLLHFFLTDELLSHVYSQASVFVFPSLYEGFGIPVIEAFQCGSPCVLSNCSSLPEIGKDAALYIDPRDEASIRETVNKLCYDQELQQKLKDRGFERLNNFSWKITAQKTLNSYQEVLS